MIKKLKYNLYIKKVFDFVSNSYEYFKTTVYYKNIIYYLKEIQIYTGPDYLKRHFNLENYKKWNKYEKFKKATQESTVTEELIKQTFSTDEEYLNYLNDIYFFECTSKLDTYLVKLRKKVLRTVDNYKLYGNEVYFKNFGKLYKNYYKELKKFTKLKPPKGFGEEYKIGFINSHSNGVKACELLLTFMKELDEEVYLKGVGHFLKALDSRREAEEIFRLIFMYGNTWSKHTKKTLLPEIIDI